MNQFDISRALITYFGFLVALTMHEAAHAFVATFLGDKSPSTAQRATINPIVHIDPLGTIIFPFLMLLSGVPFLFGWAKPTQWDSRYFKKLKRDLNTVTCAGPAANFFIAILAGIALKVSGGASPLFFSGIQGAPVTALLQSVAIANIVIGIFNILPFPNSDGWRLLTNNLAYQKAQKLEQLAMPISIIMLLLLIFGMFNIIFSPILGIFFMVFS